MSPTISGAIICIAMRRGISPTSLRRQEAKIVLRGCRCPHPAPSFCRRHNLAYSRLSQLASVHQATMVHVARALSLPDASVRLSSAGTACALPPGRSAARQLNRCRLLLV